MEIVEKDESSLYYYLAAKTWETPEKVSQISLYSNAFQQTKKRVKEEEIETGEPCSSRSSDSHKKKRKTKHLACKQCEKVFKSKRDLIVHTQSHTAERPFTCTTCNKSFIQKDHLVRHMKTHSGTLSAHVTNSISTNTDIINMHTVEDNNNTVEKKYECTTCNKSFNRKSTLSAHTDMCVSAHTSNTDIINVDTDEDDSNTVENNTVENNTNTVEKKYKCTTCGKSFDKKSNLVRHAKVHEKQYKCTSCDKFIAESAFEEHLETHTPSTPSFICTKCNKTFSTRYGLTRHMPLHSAEGKPHKCAGCSKSFLRRDQLKRHLLHRHVSVVSKGCECDVSLVSDLTLAK